MRPMRRPEAPEIHLRTLEATPEQMAERVVGELIKRGIIAAAS